MAERMWVGMHMGNCRGKKFEMTRRERTSHAQRRFARSGGMKSKKKEEK